MLYSMKTILINPKSEVLRLSSSGLTGLPLWGSCYDISTDVCRLIEQSPHRDSDVLRELSKTAIDLPLTLAKASSYAPGRSRIRHIKSSYVRSKQISALLLLSYQLDQISPESFTELNSKTSKFSREARNYMRLCNERLRRRKE